MKTQRLAIFVSSLVLLMLSVLAAPAQVSRSVEKKTFFQFPAGFSVQDENIAVSPDCRRVAFIKNLDSAETLAAQAEVEKRLRESLRKGSPAPLNKTLAGQMAGALVGHDQQAAIVDGLIQRPYERVMLQPGRVHGLWPGDTFSPDSHRVAWVGQRGEKSFLVLDGQELEPASDGFIGFAFSPDCKRLTLIGTADRKTERAFVVADGKPQKTYDGILPMHMAAQTWEKEFFFSPDGGRVVYIAWEQGKHYLVEDGREGEPFEDLKWENIRFSADGKHLAVSGKRGGKQVLVVDGQERGLAGRLLPATLTFSPDGRRLAYAVSKTGQCMLVVDGISKPVAGEVQRQTLCFSQDGRHYACVTRNGGGKANVYLDGTQQKDYNEISGSVVFSPDGQRHAYIASILGAPSRNPQGTTILTSRSVVVADGKEIMGIQAKSDQAPLFSPDGQHLAFVALTAAKQHQVVLDGVPGLTHGQIVEGSLRFSPDGRRLAYVAGPARNQTGPWTVVVDGRSQKQCAQIDTDTLTFSPDGKHLAYLAAGQSPGFRYSVVVDGMDGQPFSGKLLPKVPADIPLSKRPKRLVFDAPDSFHYLLLSEGKITLVEEKLR